MMSFWNKKPVSDYLVICLVLLCYSIAIYTYTWVVSKYVDLWRDNILIINSMLSFLIAAFILFIYYLIFWLLKVTNFLKKIYLFFGLLFVSIVDILITMVSDWIIFNKWILRIFFINYGAYIPFWLIILFFIVAAVLIKKYQFKRN